MGSVSALERYFPRLPGGDGSASSSSAGASSSIGSSLRDLDAQKRAVHSVCPIPKRRKLQQPRTVLQRRSNPAVKLLTPCVEFVDVQDTGGAQNDDRGIGVVDAVPSGVIDVSTTEEPITVGSDDEQKDEDDDDFEAEPPRKGPRRSYDNRRKFQLSWVARCPWAEALEISGVTMVKCTTCSMATGKPTILALKIATLQRHQGNYTAEKNMPGGVKKGEKYLSRNCRHLKNERTLATRAMRPINEAV
jgi:hypothetical protein